MSADDAGAFMYRRALEQCAALSVLVVRYAPRCVSGCGTVGVRTDRLALYCDACAPTGAVEVDDAATLRGAVDEVDARAAVDPGVAAWYRARLASARSGGAS